MNPLLLEKVAQALLKDAQNVVESEFPGGMPANNMWVMGNARGDPGETYAADLKTGRHGLWDYVAEEWVATDGVACGGDDLVSLIADKHENDSWSQLEAAKYANEKYKLGIDLDPTAPPGNEQPCANGHDRDAEFDALMQSLETGAVEPPKQDLNGLGETAETGAEVEQAAASLSDAAAGERTPNADSATAAEAPAYSEQSKGVGIDESLNVETPRTIIRMYEGQLHVYAPEAEKLIADDTFVRALRLVRMGRAPDLVESPTIDIKRDDEQRVIVPVNIEYLRRRLTSLAEFQKFNATKGLWFPKDCPKDLATNILLAGDWRHFAPLDAIATAPFLRPDLTVCETPGYDAASRTYYSPSATFAPLPKKITQEHAKAALERLLKPFEEFPFNTFESKSAFASHLLAAAGRHAISTRPIMCYTAPLAANGKSLLASMASRIVDGVKPPNKPFTDDSEEIRKVLMSVLIAGDSTVIFDNVPNGAKVRLPVLCAFVTSSVYSDRVLSKSESLTLPNRAAVILTGNNITPCGDLARRCITVRLDTNEETARGRTFAIPNLEEYVGRHRPDLLRDALMVIVGYQQAGRPNPGHPLESFECWSRVARDPLLWLGLPDPVKTQEVETEDDLGPLRGAFAELSKWSDALDSFTAQKLAQYCGQFMGEDLRAAVQDAGCGDATTGKEVGYWLRATKDKVAGPWKLVRLGTTGGSTRWKLRAAK